MDEKTPPKPQLDLKDRLRLSSGPSRSAQAREEEEKKAQEGKQAAESKKAVEAKARGDQFKIEGSGPKNVEWS